jgi:membrane-associated phospholipid phosphatase
MAAPDHIEQPAGYGAQLVTTVGWSFARLVRAPQPAPNPDALHRLWRQIMGLSAGGIVAILVLMFTFDAIEIGLMPPRGTPGLEPVRILTDFGKDAYVLGLLTVMLVVIFVVTPLQPLASRGRLLRFGTQVQYLLLAVVVPVLCTEVLKWAIGRGRPFVGGRADPFHFAPFHGTEAYFSLPSAHAVTAFALAFAVAALWPRLRIAMYLYAVAIGLSRLVLLAHHPSDVVAGAVVGSIGAMAVSYWFAARRLGFAIREGGRIVPR